MPFPGLFPQTDTLAAEVGQANLADGESIYKQVCQSCHGQHAGGNKTLGAPALFGQSNAYLRRQLQQFRDGTRQQQDSYAQQMASIAGTLGDQQKIDNVSAYLATISVDIDPTEGNTVASTDPGYKLYQANCGGCHGGKAEGNTAFNSPRLAGLGTDYLKRQYQHFLQGKRGTLKGDRLGRQMAMMARTVSEPEQINQLFAYIQSFAPAHDALQRKSVDLTE